MFSTLESDVQTLINWMRLAIETLGAIIIAMGVILALYQLLKRRLKTDAEDEGFMPVRLTLASFLVLGLEFQLASDVLSTAVSPSWDQIGKLAAIATIRTAMNYILLREVGASRGDRHSSCHSDRR